jgi:predicted HTH domain antitoxin
MKTGEIKFANRFERPRGVAVGYSESMETVEIRLPVDLVRAAGLNPADPSAEASQLLALELYREDKVSLGRAAELCLTPVEQFLEFAGRHNVPLHYGLDQLEEDRRTLERLGL